MGNQQSFIEEQCRRMLDLGCTYREISRVLHISSTTITKIKYQKQRNKVGRPKALTQEMTDYIEILSISNALYTDQQITRLLNERFGTAISCSTVERKRIELKFFYRPPLTKQTITEDQKLLRVQFCKWVLEQKNDFQHIVFSDESRFEHGPDNSWRRIRRGT